MGLFSKAEIVHFHKQKDRTYRKGVIDDERLGNDLKEGVWAKTELWASSINDYLPQYNVDFNRMWHQPGWDKGRVAKVKPYTWARIFKPSDENKGIYFTIGVDARRQSLLIKIHYQEQSRDPKSSCLTNEQKQLCERLIKSDNELPYNYCKEINLSIIEDYPLNRLVEATVLFIKEHEATYDLIIRTVHPPEVKEVPRQLFTFSPGPGPESDKIVEGAYLLPERTVQPIRLHYQVSQALYSFLVKNYGTSSVRAEQPTGDGKFIDLVRLDTDGVIFYEIKTYPSVRECIREAVGQLLEYSYWPNQQIAKELIIVTPHPATNTVKQYIAHLRDTLSLPISYQQFDLFKSKLLN